MKHARVFAGLGLVAAAAAVVAGLSILGYTPPAATAASVQYAPRNTAPPVIDDTTPTEGQTLTTTRGSWEGSPSDTDPGWQRCDADGSDCAGIDGATSERYTVTAADVGKRLRSSVTAINASGRVTAYSGLTDVVQAAGPSGATKLSSGETSVPASSVAFSGQRLVISDVRFTPNPVRSRFTPITVRVKVTDTRGYVVRGALVFVRSTPLVTTATPERPTGQDGWVTFVTYPERDFVLKPGYSIQFFVRARKDGEDALAGISTRRLVQVGMDRE